MSVRIDLPAEATLVAALLSAAARWADHAVVVTTADGTLTVEVEQAPAPSAAGADASAGSAPATIAPHPDGTPAVDSPSSAPVEPMPTAPETSTVPKLADAGAGAGDSAADPATAAAPEPAPATGSGAPLTCKYCDTPLERRKGSGPGRQPTTCYECKQARKRQAYERSKPAKEPETARCADCGNEFAKVRKDQRFCSRKCKARLTHREREQRLKAETAPPRPVVPAHEKPEKPIVVEPVPNPEPEQLRPAAGNPLAVERKQHECEHCGARFADKKALGLHRAAIHPMSRMKPRYEAVPEPVHIVTPHTRRATA